MFHGLKFFVFRVDEVRGARCEVFEVRSARCEVSFATLIRLGTLRVLIAILMFFKQHGLLQNLPDQPTNVGVANPPNALPLAGLDRLANQFNVVLGQNPTTSY